MSQNKFLQTLIEDPLVYYIYQRGSFIYGLNTKDSDKEYLIIIDPEYKLPEEYKEYQYRPQFYFIDRKNIKFENCDFMFLYTLTWFEKVAKNDIQAWECACLKPKFILKEHVKLLLKTDTIQLIKNIIKQVPMLVQYSVNSKRSWDFIKDLLFTQQIIDNHKIVNFKEANNYRETLNTLNQQETYNLLKLKFQQFYDRHKSQYEYYIKSIKQNE